MSLRCVEEGIFYVNNMLDFKVTYNESSFFATSFHTYTFWPLVFIDDRVFDIQFYGSCMYSQSCSIGHFLFTCRMRLKFLSTGVCLIFVQSYGSFHVLWSVVASLNSRVESIRIFLRYRL